MKWEDGRMFGCFTAVSSSIFVEIIYLLLSVHWISVTKNWVTKGFLWSMVVNLHHWLVFVFPASYFGFPKESADFILVALAKCKGCTRTMIKSKLRRQNKRQMYGSQGTILFSGFSNVCHFACVWPTALKLGCITNFDMLSLVMGFISLVHEIQFMPD